MSNSNTRLSVLGTAAATAILLFSSVDASAQMAQQRLQQERDRKEQNADAQAEAGPLYPDATREEPEGRASRKLRPELEEMMTLYNAGKQPETRAAADAIIANEDANAYELALANQVAAQAAYSLKDAAAAKTYLANAIAADGLDNNGHYQSMYMLAQLQMQDKDYAGALASIDRFLTETKATDPDYLVLKGNALYRLERFPEAIDALKQGIAAAGDQVDPAALQLLMSAYYDSNQPEAAAKVAEQALAQKPNDKQLLLNLTAVYMQADQPGKAIALLEKLRAGGQLTEDSGYRNLFILYLNSDDGQRKAIEVIEEGLDKGVLKPDYQAWVALGQAYYFTDQIGPAIENYRKAAPLAEDGRTYLNLARLLWGEGQLDAAKQAAQQALDKGLENPQDAEKILAQKG